jgi:hypothetical protein
LENLEIARKMKIEGKFYGDNNCGNYPETIKVQLDLNREIISTLQCKIFEI